MFILRVLEKFHTDNFDDHLENKGQHSYGATTSWILSSFSHFFYTASHQLLNMILSSTIVISFFTSKKARVLRNIHHTSDEKASPEAKRVLLTGLHHIYNINCKSSKHGQISPLWNLLKCEYRGTTFLLS
uniref:Uncharacterized protein n=2 Tax=Physcomitrium patens TaxID=3218 RepID=A0A2K1JCV7_PHYPA|nr:hypothetical protein PHYPA_019644 [Physcomitrium patens]